MKKRWKAWVRMPNGTSEQATVEADNPINAKIMIEHMTGGTVLGGVAQVHDLARERETETPSHINITVRPSDSSISDEDFAGVFLAAGIGIFLNNFGVWNGFLQKAFDFLGELGRAIILVIANITFVAILSKIGVVLPRPPLWLIDYIAVGFAYWIWRCLSSDSKFEGNFIVRLFRNTLLWPAEMFVFKPAHESGSAAEFILRSIIQFPLALLYVLLLVNVLIWANTPSRAKPELHNNIGRSVSQLEIDPDAPHVEKLPVLTTDKFKRGAI